MVEHGKLPGMPILSTNIHNPGPQAVQWFDPVQNGALRLIQQNGIHGITLQIKRIRQSESPEFVLNPLRQ